MTSTNFETTFAPQVVGVYEELGLDPVSTKDLEFEVEFDGDYSTACIEDMECGMCDRYADPAGCSGFYPEQKSALHDDPLFTPGVQWPYDTQLEYRCAPARAFEKADGSQHQSLTKSCQWDGTWSPDNTLPKCVCERMGIGLKGRVNSISFIRYALLGATRGDSAQLLPAGPQLGRQPDRLQHRDQLHVHQRAEGEGGLWPSGAAGVLQTEQHVGPSHAVEGMR